MFILYLHESYAFTFLFLKKLFFISVRGLPLRCPVNSPDRPVEIVLLNKCIPGAAEVQVHQLLTPRGEPEVTIEFCWLSVSLGFVFSLPILCLFCFVLFHLLVLFMVEKLFPSSDGNDWEFGFIVQPVNDFCTWINKL